MTARHNSGTLGEPVTRRASLRRRLSAATLALMLAFVSAPVAAQEQPSLRTGAAVVAAVGDDDGTLTLRPGSEGVLTPTSDLIVICDAYWRCVICTPYKCYVY